MEQDLPDRVLVGLDPDSVNRTVRTRIHSRFGGDVVDVMAPRPTDLASGSAAGFTRS